MGIALAIETYAAALSSGRALDANPIADVIAPHATHCWRADSGANLIYFVHDQGTRIIKFSTSLKCTQPKSNWRTCVCSPGLMATRQQVPRHMCKRWSKAFLTEGWSAM